MEVAAGAAAAGRGVSLGIPPQPSRKEWRAVSEPSVRITANEVQLGRDTAHVNFCTISMERNPDEDILQQRLHDVVRHREEMQRNEVELRAQIFARKDIMLMQKDFDVQMTEQVNANTKLQEQLVEMERTIHELEMQIQEKERDIHAIQLDHEAAWAKEDLLREQSKELHTFRRERDNSEAERAQHLKQILDLQEHFQEKERLYLELQEQNRVSQETILFKDEQLGEAKAWIARFQEMQSTSNHSLQAELRERTEQYNQLWISYQQQLSEMERIYLHTIHQLQLELASARERSGSLPDESSVPQIKSKDASQLALNNGSQMDVNGSGTAGASSAPLSNGNAENVTSNSSNQTEHVHGVPVAPPSLIGLPTYLQHGQVPAMHPFVIHPGVHPLPSHVAQSHVSHFHSIHAMSSLQQWQNQQTVLEASLLSNQHEYPSSQIEQNLMISDSNYDYNASGNVQVAASVQLSAPIDSTDTSYLVHSQPHENLQHITSQFNDSLRLEPESGNESQLSQEKGTNNNSSKLEQENKEMLIAQSNPTSNAPISERPNNSINVALTANNASGADAFISSEQNSSHGTGNIIIDLLDERSLLACIVRTIPPGGRIRISSTLPNRLGKMLAPLHWHDYKKKYGKLDDFLANHPELFVIEGDYIQVREGAQEIIAATAAVAKVAAAAAAKTTEVLGSQSLSLVSPSVAVTPMAQSQQRIKRTPSMDPTGGKVSGGIKILRKTQVVNGGQSSQVSPLLANGANPNKQQPALVNVGSSTQARPVGTNLVGKQQHARTTAGVTMASTK